MLLDSACYALFDELPDVVFFCKDQQGRYTHGNRTLLARLGLKDVCSLHGKTAAELFGPQLGASFLQQDLRVISTGRSVHNELEMHLFPNHQPGWCLTVKHPLRSGPVITGLCGISRDLKGPSTHHPVYRRLAASLNFARSHCTDPLSVQQLAQHAGLSVAQLERHLVGLLQLPPSRRLLSLRLDAALRLLQGADSVAAVAAQCGFADHSAFTRAFRRHVGLSPLAYRQRLPGANNAGGPTTTPSSSAKSQSPG